MSEDIEFPTEYDFGPVFSNKIVTKTIDIYNPSRRTLAWKLDIDEDYKDVFLLNEPTQGEILSKQTQTLSVSFKPMIGVPYQSSVYFVLEEKVKTMTVFGQGVEPTLNVSYGDTNFGVVGIEEPEYREITLHNPTPLHMVVKTQSDNPDFAPLIDTIQLEAGETRKIRILFKPKDTEQVQKGKVTLYQISEDSEVGSELKEEINVQWQRTGPGSRPTSNREDVKPLNDIVFEGKGGNFGFSVTGNDVEPLTEPKTATPVEENVQLSKIQIRFNRIATTKKVRKMFEVENSGDTILEFGTFDASQEPLDEEMVYTCTNGAFQYTISPSFSKILPQGKEKVYVLLEAIKDGTDEFEFFVRTKNLVRNKVVQLKVSATVYTPSDMDNLRAFVRADDNIEAKYDLKQQEERLAMTDLNLWKVLCPVVRVSSAIPSKELEYIPPIEPNVARIEMGPFVIRPPAIPEPQAPKAKKWYTNRISMAVDRLNKMEEVPNPIKLKRDQMAEFLEESSIEKNIVLDRKRHI